jgi:hypothetical protein
MKEQNRQAEGFDNNQQPACPSVFDKPDPNRFGEQKPKSPKKGGRHIRTMIVALVLCVAVAFSSSGICYLLYGQWNPFAFLQGHLNEQGEESEISDPKEEEELLIFDYSHYMDSDEDTDTLQLGGVSSIEVVNPKDSFTIESHWTTTTTLDENTFESRKEKVLEWGITKAKDRDIEGVKFSPSNVSFVVGDLLKIDYLSVYAEDGNQEIPQGGMTYFEECGIDKAKTRCTIHFGNGASITVLVGNATPTGDNCFLAVENHTGNHPDAAGAPKEDNRIYKIPKMGTTFYEKEIAYYVEKYIVEAVAQKETVYTEDGKEIEDPYFISGVLSYFDALSLSGKNYKKDFVFQNVEDSKPGYDSIYLMTSPYVQNVDLDAMENLLEPLADGLTAADCLVMKASSAQIAKYGLDTPACVARYVVKDKEYIIKIGNQVNKDEDTYAVMVEGNPSIMEVQSPYIDFKDYDEADFASDTLYSCEITKIKSFRVQMSDGTDQLFKLSHGTDSTGEATLKVTNRNGKVMDTEDFRDMYVDFLSLTSFEKVTDGKDANVPYITITITYNEYDQTDVIRLSPYTDRRYFMSLNGMGSTVVLSSAVEDLTASFETLF